MTEPQVYTELNVKELTGKNGLVAFFFPKANTPGCTIEVNEFNQHIDDFKVLGFNVVGISVSKVKDNQKFIESQKLKFPLVSDLTREITDKQFNNLTFTRNFIGMRNYKAMRTTFILDPNGKILATLRDVKPVASAKDALDKIDEIQKSARVMNAAINKGVNKAAAKTLKAASAKKKPRKSSK